MDCWPEKSRLFWVFCSPSFWLCCSSSSSVAPSSKMAHETLPTFICSIDCNFVLMQIWHCIIFNISVSSCRFFFILQLPCYELNVFDWRLRIHQRKKEGGTYSPREAEIIETKCKLDQLIAVADLELKQEKLNRLVFVFSCNLKTQLTEYNTYLQSAEGLHTTWIQAWFSRCRRDFK